MTVDCCCTCVTSFFSMRCGIGDWSFTDINDAEMLVPGDMPHHSRPLASWWASDAAEAIEIPGDEPTRHQLCDGCITQVATPDRAYCVAHEPDVLGLKPELSHPFSVADLRVPSDHGPILLRSGRRRNCPARVLVPAHIAEREDFGPMVWEVYDAERAGGAHPFESIAHLKSCVQFVMLCISKEPCCVPPQMAAGKLAAGVWLWRAVRRWDLHSAAQTAALFPDPRGAYGLAPSGDFAESRGLLRGWAVAEIARQVRSARDEPQGETHASGGRVVGAGVP